MEKRSFIMSRIRSKNTGIERKVEKRLKEMKVKFKKHYKIFGNPDFVIEDKKIAIFIDGDFWHGYRISKRIRKLPKYWQEKIRRNKLRAKRVNSKLKKDGWKVLRIWEHEINDNLDSCIKEILRLYKSKG
jgi:DNA mismatch endonuclease (patch repair protein)